MQQRRHREREAGENPARTAAWNGPRSCRVKGSETN